jgi:hypothetical protein
VDAAAWTIMVIAILTIGFIAISWGQSHRG